MRTEYEDTERLVASWRAKVGRGVPTTLAEYEAIWDLHLAEGIREGGRRRREREREAKLIAFGQQLAEREAVWMLEQKTQRAILAGLPPSGLPQA
jgi:hypothetical protein